MCINWWCHWNSKTWNKKKQEVGFLDAIVTPVAVSLVQTEISSVVKGITGRGMGVMSSGKGIAKSGRGYNNMNHMGKHFCFCNIL